MGKILEIIEELSGGKCFYTDRYSLDHYSRPEYQDEQEEFKGDKVFETENSGGKNRQLKYDASASSLFSYFLDGSRRTFKIADFLTDNKYLPIVAGQIGTAVCLRKKKKLKKHKLLTKNVLAVPDRLGGEYESIQNEVRKIEKQNIKINDIVKYRYSKNPDIPFENLAIAKIQFEMLEMELRLISEMVNSNTLQADEMLIIDGSLQFSGIKEDDEHIFRNVIGISKSFNPHLQDILKTKKKEIGHHLTNLKYAERTAVYKYEPEGKRRKKIKIGAWYLRIREKKYSKNPLDGVIKIEKIATTRKEKEDGFDTSTIDEISRAILLERNVTCYGNDDRWANHLYPIYLTELLLKNSFASPQYFLNIF
tara:strand:- start:37 stop:1131 length:1095 start_codon:yes stop_codon:yes gene_type:complete